MRLALWIAFFVISNLLGIEAFKAAVTLPSDERLVPSLLTFPLIGLTALSATRVLEAWRRRDELVLQSRASAPSWHPVCNPLHRVRRAVPWAAAKGVHRWTFCYG